MLTKVMGNAICTSYAYDRPRELVLRHRYPRCWSYCPEEYPRVKKAVKGLEEFLSEQKRIEKDRKDREKYRCKKQHVEDLPPGDNPGCPGFPQGPNGGPPPRPNGGFSSGPNRPPPIHPDWNNRPPPIHPGWNNPPPPPPPPPPQHPTWGGPCLCQRTMGNSPCRPKATTSRPSRYTSRSYYPGPQHAGPGFRPQRQPPSHESENDHSDSYRGHPMSYLQQSRRGNPKNRPRNPYDEEELHQVPADDERLFSDQARRDMRDGPPDGGEPLNNVDQERVPDGAPRIFDQHPGYRKRSWQQGKAAKGWDSDPEHRRGGNYEDDGGWGA